MRLIGGNNNFIGQFLKVWGVEKKQGKKGRKYQVNNHVKKKIKKYGERKKGDAKLTLGTTKLMAISSREEGGVEDLEDCWRRSLPEFLSFSNGAPARMVGLMMENDRMEEVYRRRKYL